MSRDLADTLHRLQLACIEPLVIAAHKRRRLSAFGIKKLSDIPQGILDFAGDNHDCRRECAGVIATERRYLRRYLFDCGSVLPFVARLQGVPAMIELDRYANFAEYERRVRQHSKGGILRQVRRVREQGFYCKIFHSDFYRRQLFAIRASKRFRSGLVLASLRRRPPASDFPTGISTADIAQWLGRPAEEVGEGIMLPEPSPPACSLHWRIDWGVFEGGGISARERLVGYVLLRRTGNIVRTAGLMGHGTYLSQNVMKLLFHDVMSWLLSRADPCVLGLRYLLYGAMEHGNDGLFEWKRSFEFTPFRFASQRGPESHLTDVSSA